MFNEIWTLLVVVGCLLFGIVELITRFPQLSEYRWILFLLVPFVAICSIMNILDKKTPFNYKMKFVAGLFFILAGIIYLSFKDLFEDFEDSPIFKITFSVFFVLSGFTFLVWKIVSSKNRRWGGRGAHLKL